MTITLEQAEEWLRKHKANLCYSPKNDDFFAVWCQETGKRNKVVIQAHGPTLLDAVAAAIEQEKGNDNTD